eukprot:1215638-Prymnesium_polylepis.1
MAAMWSCTHPPPRAPQARPEPIMGTFLMRGLAYMYGSAARGTWSLNGYDTGEHTSQTRVGSYAGLELCIGIVNPGSVRYVTPY